jgi:hypothetical protein
MEPKGSTYTGNFEEFASGRPFPVTDVVIAKDGAMYVTTGGRRTQSGLYRITWAGAPVPVDSVATSRSDQGRFQQRRDCEAWHDGFPDDKFFQSDVGGSFTFELTTGDAFVQRAARLVLQQIDPKSGYGEYTDSQSLIALLNSHPQEYGGAVVNALEEAFQSPSDENMVERLRVTALALCRAPQTKEALVARVRPLLEKLYPYGSARIDRELLQVLVALDSPHALVPALDVLESDAAQEERIWRPTACASRARAGRRSCACASSAASRACSRSPRAATACANTSRKSAARALNSSTTRRTSSSRRSSRLPSPSPLRRRPSSP